MYQLNLSPSDKFLPSRSTVYLIQTVVQCVRPVTTRAAFE